jgi:hypothetical protein
MVPMNGLRRIGKNGFFIAFQTIVVFAFGAIVFEPRFIQEYRMLHYWFVGIGLFIIAVVYLLPLFWPHQEKTAPINPARPPRPNVEWLTGADLMGHYGISGTALYQYIYNGLPIYPKSADEVRYNLGCPPLSLEDIGFEIDYEINNAEDSDSVLAGYLFKTADAEVFLFSSWQDENTNETPTEDVFYNINLPALKNKVLYWGGGRWEGVVRSITLYPAPPGQPNIGGMTLRYLLHFEVYDERAARVIIGDDDRFDCMHLFSDKIELGSVYKQKPKGEYQNEWYCVMNLPDNVDKKYAYRLYPR